jgi:hypothetical protein
VKAGLLHRHPGNPVRRAIPPAVEQAILDQAHGDLAGSDGSASGASDDQVETFSGV